MTVNLAWRDALAVGVVGRAFNRAEHVAGWAESFSPWQIAILQRPWKAGESGGRLACNALYGELDTACKAGKIANRTWTETKPETVPRARSQSPQRIGWDSTFGYETEGMRRDRLWREAHPTVTTTREVNHTHITAQDFAAWLAANDIEPSRHVAAWFKAMGVETDSKPIAPPAAKAVALAETTKQRNARWLAVFDEDLRNGPKDGAQSRAMRRIVEAEGVTASTAKKGIQNAERDRAESYRDGKVTPMKHRPAKPATAFDGLMNKR